MTLQVIQYLKSFSDPKDWQKTAKDIVGNQLGCTFTNHKKYDSFPLNNSDAMRKGLEVFRVLASYWAAQLRGCPEEFLTNGAIIKENFLSDADHFQVVKEVSKFPLRVNKSSQNLIQQSQVLSKNLGTKLYTEVYNCIKIHDKNKFTSNTFVQRIHNKSEGHLIEKGGEDAQFRIHTDIFSPAIKYWYFPEEVTLEQGPLMYAFNSPGISDNILKIWYEESVKITSGETIPEWKQPSHKEGSLRITKEELKSLGYELTSLTVPKNTLVLANVHGFHRRGQGTGEDIRTSIHGSIRVDNPFNVN